MGIRDVVFVYRLASPELIRWHSRRHTHGAEEYELHYFLGGEGRFETESNRYVIAHGALFFSRPGELHSITPGDVRRPLSYYAVLFDLPEADPLLPVVESAPFLSSFPRMEGSRHRLLFEYLKTGYVHRLGARRHAADHKLHSFLWELAGETESRDSGADTPAGTVETYVSEEADYNVHIARAISLFENNLAGGTTIAGVAAALGITQSHLTRLFTHHYGVSPLQYYRRMRMDVGASMLLDSTRSIKEIAWELGYSNPFHFSRSFRKYADMSPLEYRKQYYRNNPTDYAARVISAGRTALLRP